MTAPDRPGPWRARLGLFALFALFFLPVVGSMVIIVAKPGWAPSGTINQGELIDPPRPVNLSKARAADGGSPMAARAEQGIWALVHVGSSDCGESCERALIAMRQARLALGKDAERVTRLWLMTGETAPVRMRAILSMLPGLRVFHASTELASQFPRAGGDAVYVIDPTGLLILRYDGTETASRALMDMKRLLKISKQG